MYQSIGRCRGSAEDAADVLEDAGEDHVDAEQVHAEEQRDDQHGDAGLDQVVLAGPGDLFHLAADVAQVIAHAPEYIVLLVHVHAGQKGLEPPTPGFGDRCSTI